LREYILTEQERKIIEEYLTTGKKLEGFKMIVFRARRMQTINKDLELIARFLKKVEGSKV
jgi:hypothetical protein